MTASGPARTGAKVRRAAEVRAAMARAHAGGALERVRASEMLLARRAPGTQVQVRDRLPADRARLRLALRVVGVVAALGVAGSLVWLCVLAVLEVIAVVAAAVAWVNTHLLLLIGVLAAALFGWLLLVRGSGGGCAGLHCRGCRR